MRFAQMVCKGGEVSVFFDIGASGRVFPVGVLFMFRRRVFVLHPFQLNWGGRFSLKNKQEWKMAS
jgi:hypothetical protein